jgi:hypothetical protein
MPELEYVTWECPECGEIHDDPEWETSCRVCGLVVMVLGENCVQSLDRHIPVAERGPEAFPGQRAQYYAAQHCLHSDAPPAPESVK